jgi:tetratricopeptide (TPR) repeat protein
LAQRSGNVEELGACLINLGVAQMRLGRLDEGIAADRRAIAEFERIGHAAGQAVGRVNLADKLLQSGQLEAALATCLDGIERARVIGRPFLVADGTMTMASVRLEMGDARAAAANAEDAAAQFAACGAAEQAREALALAARARSALS